jgi:hypothetical protein
MDDKEVLARSLPPPVDVAVDGNFAGKLTRHLMAELKGWIALPLIALGLAGLLALLLALARAPYVGPLLPWTSSESFRRLLVVHVSFAFVVWYLGVLAAMTVVATAQSLNGGGDDNELSPFSILVGRLAVYGAAVSFILLLIPALANWGVPAPNNYVPVLVHPLYYGGLALLAASVALPVLRLLLLLMRQPRPEAGAFGVACAGVIFLIALVCVGAAWLTMPANVGPEGTAEYLFWGGGHILQFANTALMLCGFYLVSRIALGETPLPPKWFGIAMLLLVAGAAAGPLLYVTYHGGDPSQRMVFTYLYWFALPIPAALVLLAVVRLLARRARDVWEGAPEVKGMTAALLLFAYGGILGFFEGSVDTRTPAHYHAMLIAITLAFMTMYFALFLPLAGRRTPRRRLRTAMYLLLGVGQALHSTGLYIAGAEGVARKVAGAAQDLDSATKIGAMVTEGVGGVIAVLGGIIFIVLAARLLLARPGRGVTASPLSSARAGAE